MLFRGKYAFLTNMYTCDIPCIIRGQKYLFHNAEALYQAMKCPERAREFEPLTGPEAKCLGRTIQLRPDWDKIKLEVMARVVRAKFDANPQLVQKLLETGDIELVEHNNWKDTYWGVCAGKGENHMGKALMAERAARRATMAKTA